MMRKRIELAEKEKRSFEQWRKRCAKEYGTVTNAYHSPTIKRVQNDDKFIKMVMIDDSKVSSWQMKSSSKEKLTSSPISSPKMITNVCPVQLSPPLHRRQMSPRKTKKNSIAPPVRIEHSKRLPLLPRQSLSVPCVTIDQLVRF